MHMPTASLIDCIRIINLLGMDTDICMGGICVNTNHTKEW